MFVTLYPQLREYEQKCFNYFRMSIKSFDDFLELIKEEEKQVLRKDFKILV